MGACFRFCFKAESDMGGERGVCHTCAVALFYLIGFDAINVRFYIDLGSVD